MTGDVAESKVEGQVKRLKGEVTSSPSVRRNANNEVTSISFNMKAAFVGDVSVKARGDVAAGFWSITRGMKVSVEAVESGVKDYTATSMEVIPNAPPADA